MHSLFPLQLLPTQTGDCLGNEPGEGLELFCPQRGPDRHTCQVCTLVEYIVLRATSDPLSPPLAPIYCVFTVQSADRFSGVCDGRQTAWIPKSLTHRLTQHADTQAHANKPPRMRATHNKRARTHMHTHAYAHANTHTHLPTHIRMAYTEAAQGG